MTPPTAAPAICIACASAPRGSFLLRGDVRLLRCPRCGLAWWSWPPFDPQQFYDRDYFQSDGAEKGYSDYASLEPGVRRTARARLQRIARLLRRSAAPGSTPSIFEIGCGTGLFLDEARRAGYTVAGLEVSEFAATSARQRGLDVRCEAIEGRALPGGPYDCVALWDVIEHLRDPGGVLRAAGAALRPGGVLALSTGDVTSWCARLSGARWHLFNLPEHLFFFSPAALVRLLRAADCDVALRRSEVAWVPVSYLFERLGKSPGVVGRLTRWVRPATLRATRHGWVVPATLFDVIGLYAVRRGSGAT